MDDQNARVHARASLKAPPAMQSIGEERVAVVLKETDDGRYRWYREDGTPTVVASSTVEGASRTARLVWRNWGLEFDEFAES